MIRKGILIAAGMIVIGGLVFVYQSAVLPKDSHDTKRWGYTGGNGKQEEISKKIHSPCHRFAGETI